MRVGLALTVCIFAARALPEPGKLLTLVYAALLGVLYLLILVLTRELRRADLDLVRAVVRRKE